MPELLLALAAAFVSGTTLTRSTCSPLDGQDHESDAMEALHWEVEQRNDVRYARLLAEGFRDLRDGAQDDRSPAPRATPTARRRAGTRRRARTAVERSGGPLLVTPAVARARVLVAQADACLARAADLEAVERALALAREAAAAVTDARAVAERR